MYMHPPSCICNKRRRRGRKSTKYVYLFKFQTFMSWQTVKQLENQRENQPLLTTKLSKNDILKFTRIWGGGRLKVRIQNKNAWVARVNMAGEKRLEAEMRLLQGSFWLYITQGWIYISTLESFSQISNFKKYYHPKKSP